MTKITQYRVYSGVLISYYHRPVGFTSFILQYSCTEVMLIEIIVEIVLRDKPLIKFSFRIISSELKCREITHHYYCHMCTHW